MTQTARLESLERFRQNQAAFLLATDVAARGLDISGVKVSGAASCMASPVVSGRQAYRVPSMLLSPWESRCFRSL